jgi:hypothetical protein
MALAATLDKNLVEEIGFRLLAPEGPRGELKRRAVSLILASTCNIPRVELRYASRVCSDILIFFHGFRDVLVFIANGFTDTVCPTQPSNIRI